MRREVAMRKHTHEKMNAERKLTDDQRREKVENKKHEEEKKGICGAVFKCVCHSSFFSLLSSDVFGNEGSSTCRTLLTASKFGKMPSR